MLGSFNLSKSSLGSMSARFFLNVLGVTSTAKGLLDKKPTKDYFSNLYTQEVRRYAKQKEGWSALTDNLSVEISDDEKIKIVISGSDDDLRRIAELEYGTPQNPPVSVIRVMEESLRQDHSFNKKRVGL